jgi:hypothetical protein
MKPIATIFRRLFLAEPEKKLLGRWNIEHCDKMLNNKIDLSNEDHCGPCGQYILNKTGNGIIVYSTSIKLGVKKTTNTSSNPML